jgi:hypothetical protein
MPDSAVWHEKNEVPHAFTAVVVSLSGTRAIAGMRELLITISTACPLLAIKHLETTPVEAQ